MSAFLAQLLFKQLRPLSPWHGSAFNLLPPFFSPISFLFFDFPSGTFKLAVLNDRFFSVRGLGHDLVFFMKTGKPCFPFSIRDLGLAKFQRRTGISS